MHEADGTGELLFNKHWSTALPTRLGQPCSLEVVVIEKQGWDSLPASKEPGRTINRSDNDKYRHSLRTGNPNPHRYICCKNWRDLLSQSYHHWCFWLLHPHTRPAPVPPFSLSAACDAQSGMLPSTSCPGHRVICCAELPSPGTWKLPSEWGLEIMNPRQ